MARVCEEASHYEEVGTTRAVSRKGAIEIRTVKSG